MTEHYYWVKYEGEWTPLLYDIEDDEWYCAGSEVDLDTKYFDEIGDEIR